MNSATKTTLVICGFLSTVLLLVQLVLGLLILSGASEGLRKAHQHSGYLTVTVALFYIVFSLSKIAATKTTDPIPTEVK